MKKKKILFLNPFVYPHLAKGKSYDEWKYSFGGAQLTIMSIIKGFEEKKKYKLVVFVWNEFINGLYKTCGELQFVSGFYKRWSKKGKIYNLFFLLHSTLLLLIVNPDYIIKAGYEKNWEVVISLYSFIFRKKYLFLVVKSTDLITNDNFTNKAILRFLGITNVYFICQSRLQIKQVEETVNGKKHRMIKNILLMNKSYKRKPEYRDYVLWVGRNDNVKNPLAFISLCKKLDQGIKKIMVCTINEGDFISFETIEHETRNMENFILIKDLDYDDSQVYFKYAKVHVNTSYFEGFPNTFLQAFYEGIPIASLHFNADNFINNEECGLFANSDEDELKTCVEFLYYNEEKWKYYSEKVKEYYKRELDFKANMNLLEECVT